MNVEKRIRELNEEFHTEIITHSNYQDKLNDFFFKKIAELELNIEELSKPKNPFGCVQSTGNHVVDIRVDLDWHEENGEWVQGAYTHRGTPFNMEGWIIKETLDYDKFGNPIYFKIERRF